MGIRPITDEKRVSEALALTNGEQRGAGPLELGSAGFSFRGVFGKAEFRLGARSHVGNI